MKTIVDIRVVKTFEDEFELVINKGSSDGIRSSFEFLVYDVGEEIIDPITGESLGNIEYVKGTGKVKHIQDKLTIIESLEMKYDVETSSQNPLLTNFKNYHDSKKEKRIKVPLPFQGPKVGDKVKITRY